MRTRFRFWRLVLRIGAAALILAQGLLMAGVGLGHSLPRGGLLAFSTPINPISEWHIMLMDVRSRLTLQLGEYSWRLAVGLSWSPDGSKLAFATYAPRSDIFVIDIYAGKIRNLTDDWAEDRYPAWSPDSQHIAFFSNRDYLPAARYDIYVMDVGSPVPQRITFTEALYPSWSPDGSNIVYSSRSEGNLYRLDVGCVRLPAGCQMRQQPLTSTFYDDRNPVLSPDGQRIAFLSFHSSGTSDQVFIVNRDGGELRRLAPGWRFQGMPAWSPDGHSLAFVGKAQTEQTDSLYVADMHGAEMPRKLAADTYYAYNERWPMWSPDGHYIAFSHRETGGLYRVEVASGRIEQLSRTAAYYPVWQP